MRHHRLLLVLLAAAACDSGEGAVGTVEWTIDPIVGQGVACGIAFVGDDIIIAADFPDGPVDLGGGQLSAVSGDKTVLARFSPSGEHKWSVGFSPACKGLSVAADGTVLLARQLGNAVSITALDADSGMLAFTNYLPPPEDTVVAHDVAMSPNGEIVVVGSFKGRWMGNVIQLESEDELDAFVVFLGPAGEERRGYSFNGGPADEARSVAVNLNNQVAISGVGAAADLGVGTAGGSDRFLLLMDRMGNKVYALSFPPAGVAHGVATDGEGVLSFDGIDMLRVDPAGEPMWTYPVDTPVDVAGSAAGVALAEIGRVSKLTPEGARVWYADVAGMLTVAAISPQGRIAVGGTTPLFTSFAP